MLGKYLNELCEAYSFRQSNLYFFSLNSITRREPSRDISTFLHRYLLKAYEPFWVDLPCDFRRQQSCQYSRAKKQRCYRNQICDGNFKMYLPSKGYLVDNIDKDNTHEGPKECPQKNTSNANDPCREYHILLYLPPASP